MLQTNVVLEGDGSLKEIAGLLEEGEGIHTISALKDGMASGKPSVAIVSKMKNGKYLFAQTSMNIFLSAAKVFEAKFGPPSDQPTPPPPSPTIDPEAGVGKAGGYGS